MKKMYLFMLFLIATSFAVKAQYLFQDFEAAFTGAIPAPAGSATTIPANAAGDWTQTRIVAVGDGTTIKAAGTAGQKDWIRNYNNPMTGVWTVSNGSSVSAPFGGDHALFIEDRNFGSGFYGARRVESPAIDLSMAVTPYVRLKLSNSNTGIYNNVKVVALDPATGKWRNLMILTNNSNTSWLPIAIKIPASLKVASVKFGIEVNNGAGGNNIFVDNFSVEEFTPVTLTSTTTGNFGTGTTWVGGVAPTPENNVVIAAGHTITVTSIRAKCQDLTIQNTAIVQGSTLATDYFQIFNDLKINAGGTYRSYNGSNGRVTMLGGSLINDGTCNFTGYSGSGANYSPSSGTTMHSVLFFCGGEVATVGGIGTFTTRSGGTSQFYNVWFANSGGVTFNKPIVIGRTAGLYDGVVNPNSNLTIGESTLGILQNTERAKGSFAAAPIWGSGITSRGVLYVGPTVGSTSIPYGSTFLSSERETITTGEEIETISGNKQIIGAITLNTFDHIALGAPVYLGSATVNGSLNLNKGILFSTATNMLIFNPATTGGAGTNPSNTTIDALGTSFPTNQGSFVNGPIRFISAATTSGARNFPLGVGSDFLPTTFTGTYGTAPNYTVNNLRKTLTLTNGVSAWASTDFTVSIVTAPSGIASSMPLPVLTGVTGNRAYKIEFNNTVALPTTTTAGIIGHKSGTDGGATVSTTSADNLAGSVADLRLGESPDLTGPWSNRNGSNPSTGAGIITGAYFNSSTTTTLASSVSPVAIGDDFYLAWGSVAPLLDLKPVSLITPVSGPCIGSSNTVTARVNNNGLNTIDFSTNPATITVAITGPIATSINTTINTGTLAPGANLDVVVGTANLSTIGTYNFAVSNSMTGDGNLVNDALTPNPTIINNGIIQAVASGDWSASSTWCNGLIPTTTNKVEIPTGINVTVSTGTANSDSLTLVGTAKLTVTGGVLNVGGATCGGREELLTSSTSTLDVQGGQINIMGALRLTGGGIFKQSGGVIRIDGNDGTTSGSYPFAGLLYTNGNPGTGSDVNGGKIIIVDPNYATNTTGNTVYMSVSTTDFIFKNHILQLGDQSAGACQNTGTNSTGFNVDCYPGSNYLLFDSIIVDGGSTASRHASPSVSTANGTYLRSLNITSGSEWRVISGLNNYCISGNITNDGTMTHFSGSTLNLAVKNSPATPSTMPQSIGGAGTYRDLLSGGSASFVNVLVNNTNTIGVTLDAAIKISGQLTLTSGIVNTTTTNLLTLNAGAAFSGTPSATAFINGPIKKIGNTAFIFPTGKKGAPNRLGRCGISATGLATDAYTAEYFQTPYSSLLSSGPLSAIDSVEYWDIARIGVSMPNVTLFWSDGNFSGIPGTISATNITVGHYNSMSTFWEALPYGSHSGSRAAGGSITTNAVSNFSPFTIGLIAGTLPIAVNSFTATKQNSNTNAINWKATCTGASVSFELQRSTNGIVFVPINSLTATQARCAAPFNYVDNYNATSPITYYKLKVISNTGEVKYSQIVAINNKNANANTMALYPNIVKGNAVLVVESKTTTNANFVITDAKGAIIRRFTENLSEGANAYPINVNSLSAGNYQITGIIDGALKTIRFIKE